MMFHCFADWSNKWGAAALVVRSVGVIPLHCCHSIFFFSVQTELSPLSAVNSEREHKRTILFCLVIRPLLLQTIFLLVHV